MRYSGEGPLLLDSSAAIALSAPAHAGYVTVREFVLDCRLGLAGHAVFETYSVLTRMPRDTRPSGAQIREMVRRNFPETRMLSQEGQLRVLDVVAEQGFTGGQIYDALVGAAAAEAELPLVSRDQRAARVYEAVGARFEIL